MNQSGLMDSAKILFVCPSCGYRAKIPGNYLGMSIRCPGCNSAQTVAKPTDPGQSTGRTVTITKVAATPLPFTIDEAKNPSAPAAPANTAPAARTRTPLPGALDAVVPPSTPADQALGSGGAAATLVFVCTACAYRARIPKTYGGRTILCPKCNAAQQAPPSDQPAQPSTGQTVIIAKVATTTPAHGTPALPSGPVGSIGAPERASSAPAGLELSEKILFTCAACSMRARLPAKYAGMTIKCPKCQKPGTVPLSDAVEAATGRTVTITRADIASTPSGDAGAAAKRPSGEIAMPPAAARRPSGEVAALAAPSKRPSGEIAMPPTKSAAPGLEIDLGADAPAESSPFQGQATLDAAAPSSAPEGDDLLDLGGAPAKAAEPKKGGVVKRRGSSSSSTSMASGANAPAKAEAKPDTAARAKADAAKAEAARPAAKAPAKSPTPAPAKAKSGQAETESNPAIAADDEPAAPARAVAKRPAPAPSRVEADDDARPAKRGLPWAWLAAVIVLAIACAALAMQWNAATAELAQTRASLEAATKATAAEKARADKAEDKARTLTAELDTAKQEATAAGEKADQLAKEAEELKAAIAAQKAELDKAVADLKQKLDEQARLLEEAKQGFNKKK